MSNALIFRAISIYIEYICGFSNLSALSNNPSARRIIPIIFASIDFSLKL
jgi:hypothetical protein